MKPAINLPIKRKWFDMIAAGEKKEEYRDYENQQLFRLYNWMEQDKGWLLQRPVAVFRNGYNMQSRALAVKIERVALRGSSEIKHPEWGEPKQKRLHFVVSLGNVLCVGKYCIIKDFVKNLSQINLKHKDDFL